MQVRVDGLPPGLGSYATKADRLDGRGLAATLLGDPGRQGGRDRRRARARLRPDRLRAAHDEIFRDDRGFYRETNRAGGLEAGMTNGEPLDRQLLDEASADADAAVAFCRPRRRKEPGNALVERSDVSAVEALAVIAEASVVAFELAVAARDKFGGDSIGDFVAAREAYVERIDWSPR